MKNGKVSKFKGFVIKDKEYKISSFECKSCANYCEINRVKVQGEESYLFYGGRCEKYEKKDAKNIDLVDPVSIREKLLWKVHKEYEEKYNNRKAPTIGIPYVFYFLEQLPFWSTLLWELGFNVKVSGKTNKEIINKGTEKVLSEACFPLKVAYGHILDLVEKGVDLIFLPSFINLNLYDEYERGLACPLVQTIPYVSRGMFKKEKIKIIIPRIDFSRGFDYLKKELQNVFKEIVHLKNLDTKIDIAREKQKEFVTKLQKEGLKLLELSKEKTLGHVATAVIIGRAYNSFDKAVSLDISGKLTKIGVLPIPFDMLPFENINIKDTWSNLYWRSGQKDVMKNGKVSKFKGFVIKDKEYKISSFECKSCANYCEINRVKVQGEESYLFYGGRCEKYEKKDAKNIDLVDPVSIREKLLWKVHKEYEEKYNNRKAPTIGIPYVFYFLEQLPFWSTLLWELGFNVKVSGKTNKEIINKGTEKVLSEACFPLKVAYGHILDLVEKGVDLIFLPSFINLNLYDEYERGLACPLVQTIPYVSRGMFKKEKIKIIIPRIDFSRGFDYLKKELQNVFKEIVHLKNLDTKIDIAREKQKEFVTKLQKEGLKLLELSKEKTLGHVATAVIIGRAYNSFDKAVSLDISGKLTKIGVLPIPFDMLPFENINIKDTWSNLYWRSGQRIIKATKFIQKLDSLYPVFITNFSCGPDSFIINYFKEEMGQHPYLILEIDEHSADAGIVTRLEAFIDSIKSRKYDKTIEKPIFLPLLSKSSNSDLSKRTIFIPRMSDHAFALKAAFNYCGIDAEVMPPSDKTSIELARKHVCGGECFPYVVTLGDMLKIVYSKDFNPEKTAFFMPSGAGPCRFGQYNISHRMMLKKLGFENVPVYSPQQDAQFYKDLNIAGGEFSLRAWQGIVAYGILTKLLLQCRPYEKNKGETEALYEQYLQKIFEALKSKNGDFDTLLKNMRKDFENIPKYKDKKPLIGIVGEIFVRSHAFSNENLIKRLESLGVEVYLTPIEEWIHYVNKMAFRKALIKKDKSAIIKILINKFFQWRVEKNF
jgi:predicted nucleotide-binding protein (sugar kinase/HSP70/actin superfamily)